MRWGEQITLIALSEPSPRTNEHGFPVARTETAITVFADKKSVGFSEFYKAQQAGYTTELKFDVHSFEYEEQQIVEYPFRAETVSRPSDVHARERRIYRVDAG